MSLYAGENVFLLTVSLMSRAMEKAKITIFEHIDYLFSEWSQFGFIDSVNDFKITTQ